MLKELSPYWRLARFDKPIGTILLWSPTAWALWLATQGKPPLYLVVIFLLGTLFMRAAGCTVNDIIDRTIDIHVQRTRLRPVASGELTVQQAGFFLLLVISLPAVLLFFLPITCFYLACVALLIMGVYPFCKRCIHAPQAVLGLAFSMGIPMVYVAAKQPLDGTVAMLMLLNIAWTIAYDTQYAMVDRQDDLRIGVKSTAILFADYDCLIIGLLQGFCHTIWLIIAIQHALPPIFYVGWFLAGMNMICQQRLIKNRLPKDCFQAFLSNGWYGGILWIALIGLPLSTCQPLRI